MKRWLAVLGFVAIFALVLLPFLAFAQAAGIPDPSDNIATFLGAVLAAVKGGDWQVVTALGLVGLVWATRKWGAKAWPWLGTSEGGAVFAAVLIFLPLLAAALYIHTPITAGLIGTILLTTWTAAGAWTWGRRVLALLSKIPGSMGKFFGFILGVLGGDPAAKVKQAADQAPTSTPPGTPGSGIASGLDG